MQYTPLCEWVSLTTQLSGSRSYVHIWARTAHPHLQMISKHVASGPTNCIYCFSSLHCFEWVDITALNAGHKKWIPNAVRDITWMGDNAMQWKQRALVPVNMGHMVIMQVSSIGLPHKCVLFAVMLSKLFISSIFIYDLFARVDVRPLKSAKFINFLTFMNGTYTGDTHHHSLKQYPWL